MKQDKLDQIFKESLESVNPEVPAHLWDNIRANIPSAPATEAVSGAGQSAAGSSGAGATGLIKLGAAAIVLIGGGVLVWQLNSGEVDKATTSNEVSVEQSEATPLNESKDHVSAIEQESREEVVVGNDRDETASSSAESTEELAIADDSPEAHGAESSTHDSQVADQPESSHTASGQEKAGQKGQQASVSEQSTGQTAEKSGQEISTVEVEAKGENTSGSDAQTATTPNPVPLQVVEVGILADEVYGEAPLSIQFSNVTGAKSYDWDFGNGRKSNEASPMPTFDRPGEYTVELTVTDFEGNRLSDEMEISVIEPSVIYQPDVFTPNGDGLNDFFEVKGTNISEVTFEIFRLDGSLVYTGTDLNDKWDGSDRQQPGNRQYMVVTRYVKNDGTPSMEKSMLTVIRE